VPSVANGNVVVLGLADVKDAMDLIGRRATQSAVRRALYAGAVIMRDEARRRVPIRTGALRKSIVASTDKAKSGQNPAARVRIVNKVFGMRANKAGKMRLKHLGSSSTASIAGNIYPRNYAHMVEFGTRAHYLGAGGKQHPGARPKPFLRPAFESKIDAAKARFAEVIQAEFAKALSARSKKGK